MEEKSIQIDVGCGASQKTALEFLHLLLKLDPAEFLGVAGLLGVGFMRNKADVEAEAFNMEGEEKENYIKLHSIRDANLITSDMIDKFCGLNRAKRRELMKIIRKAI